MKQNRIILLWFVIVAACNNHTGASTEKGWITNSFSEDIYVHLEDPLITTNSNSVDGEFHQSNSNQQLDKILDKMYSCSNLNSESKGIDTISMEECLYFFKHLNKIIESEYEPASLCVYEFLFRNDNSCSKFLNAIAVLSKNDSERDELLCKVLDVIWLDCCISGGYDTKTFQSLSKDFPLFQNNKQVENSFNHLVRERNLEITN